MFFSLKKLFMTKIYLLILSVFKIKTNSNKDEKF